MIAVSQAAAGSVVLKEETGTCTIGITKQQSREGHQK